MQFRRFTHKTGWVYETRLLLSREINGNFATDFSRSRIPPKARNSMSISVYTHGGFRLTEFGAVAACQVGLLCRLE